MKYIPPTRGEFDELASSPDSAVKTARESSLYYNPTTQLIHRLREKVTSESKRLGRPLTGPEIEKLADGVYPVWANQKHFCKRHNPVLFPLYRGLCTLLDHVLPWVLVTLACAGVAASVVELLTKTKP